MQKWFRSKKKIVLLFVSLLVLALTLWCVVDVCTGIARINTYAKQPKPGQSAPMQQAILEYSDHMAELQLPQSEGIDCPDYKSFLSLFDNVAMDYAPISPDLAYQTAYSNMVVQGRILGWFSGEQDSTQFILLVTKNIVGKRGVLRTLRVAVPQGSNCAEILKNTGEAVLFLDVIDKEKSLTRLHLHEHSIFEVEFSGRVRSFSDLPENQYYSGKASGKLTKTVQQLARAMEIE